VATTYQYDGLDRLTRLTHTKAPTTIADFQYQFNAVSNITQMADSAGAHNYSYDTVDRFTSATHPNQTNESYTFDAVGNRTASHRSRVRVTAISRSTVCLRRMDRLSATT
jgi:YD repeat-containing protein